MAYILCVASKKREAILSVDEVQNADRRLILLIQRPDFGSNMDLFDDNRELKKLNPYIDNEGVIRIKGRLQGSTSGISSKPVILSGKVEIVKRIIEHYHQEVAHM